MKKSFVILLLAAVAFFNVAAVKRPEPPASFEERFVAQYPPFKAMGLDPARLAAALEPFYLTVLPKGNKLDLAGLAHINGLVNIYLRTHKLQICGHTEEHDTAGTPCSIAPGSPLDRSLHAVLRCWVDRKVLKEQQALYIARADVPKLPGKWEVHQGRIKPTELTITDDAIEAKRRHFIARGYQTAVRWSREELATALRKERRGITLDALDAKLNPRGLPLRADMIRNVVRPLYLIAHGKHPTYGKSLRGLVPFLLANRNKELHLTELDQLKKQAPGLFQKAHRPVVEPAKPAAPVTATPRAARPSPCAARPAPEPKARPVPRQAIVKTPPKPQPAPVASRPMPAPGKTVTNLRPRPAPVPAVTPSGATFQRAFGGTRFGTGWAPVEGKRR